MSLAAEPTPEPAPDPTNLNGRTLFVWPRGRSPVAGINALADAIVASGAHLFNLNDRLVWLNDDGELVLVSLIVLREIVTKFIATKQLVNHGIAEKPEWAVEYRSLSFDPVADITEEPSELVLRVLLGVKQPYSDLPDNIAPLLQRVPRA